MRNFKNKTILVTGAAGNLGTAICESFGKEGARIIAFDLQAEPLQKLEKRLTDQNIEVFTKAFDLTNKEALLQAIEAGRNAFGDVAVLVNNAGITHIQRFLKVEDPEATLHKVMEVNLFAAVNCTEALLKDIIKNKGVIVNISSVAGIAPLLGRTAYAASKHALHGYFESLRSEVIEDGVQCLMVCPSFISPDPKVVDLSKTNEHSIYQDKKALDSIDPQFIATKIVKAAKRNKPRLVIGKSATQVNFLLRFAPSLYEKLMRKKLSKEL